MSETIDIKWIQTPKQALGWKYLSDKTTDELGFGGASRGAKSWFSITSLVVYCLNYPDTRYALGRKELKNLKRTSLQTFFKICREYGIVKDKHYHYNQQEGVIKFYNQSEIILLDLAFSPSDPFYLRFGGLEITGAVIEESNETPFAAVDILGSRVGNWNNEKYNIKPFTIETFNPDKGHVYRRFYKPWRDNTLPKNVRFVRALPKDNPYNPKSVLAKLLTRDPITVQRLVYGNFEYDDDPAKLFEFDALHDIFTNVHKTTGEKYLTVDIARFGKDNTVLFFWDGFHIYKIKSYHGLSVPQNISMINSHLISDGIPRRNTAIDEDGIGGGVVDGLPGVVGFVNNSKAFSTQKTESKRFKTDKVILNYANLKAQCFFTLSEFVRLNKISCYDEIPSAYQDALIEELQQVKQLNPDNDTKLAIIPKKIMKQNLGRSPDFADACMQRMIFVVNKKKRGRKKPRWAFSD